MKSLLFKQITSVSLIILAVLSIYFGSYLPFAKAQRYIAFMQSIGTIRTLEQFSERSKSVFDFYSPVGQEETVRFLSRDILNIVRNPNQPEKVSRDLVGLAETYVYRKNVRHLLTMAEAYSVLWEKHNKKEEDFLEAESYLLQALSIGPNLPPALYSLFDLYRAHGDEQKMKGIRDTILKFWPDEKRVL